MSCSCVSCGYCCEAGGLYLAEVDRVLRPGGYWVLSGPPIYYKRLYKGWQRSKEDCQAEQDGIETVSSDFLPVLLVVIVKTCSE